jgi:hypothetical protein
MMIAVLYANQYNFKIVFGQPEGMKDMEKVLP